MPWYVETQVKWSRPPSGGCLMHLPFSTPKKGQGRQSPSIVRSVNTSVIVYLWWGVCVLNATGHSIQTHTLCGPHSWLIWKQDVRALMWAVSKYEDSLYTSNITPTRRITIPRCQRCSIVIPIHRTCGGGTRGSTPKAPDFPGAPQDY